VTGQEWLKHTLGPALRTTNPSYEKLRAEMRALSDSGVLSKDEAARARAQLDEAERDRRAIVRRRTERAVSQASRVGGDRDRLEGLLAPKRPLGEVDGVTVIVVLVELWSQRLVLRLKALRNELTDAFDATFDREWKAYEGRWVHDRAAAEAEDLQPPEQPSVSRLSGLSLSVADDVGTRYHAIGTATGGSEHPWRCDWRLEPGMPRSATVLRIGLEGSGHDRECLELRPPWRT
jgi:hypothetical protein